MPRGGARKGAGRKPKPLAEKIAAGNPGRRPLKKVQFQGESKQDLAVPEVLNLLAKKSPVPPPTEIYQDTIELLEPSGCLPLIPRILIQNYVMACYYLSCAQYDLSKTAILIQDKVDKQKFEISGFTDAYLKLQKNAAVAWQPIWDIVQRNSEVIIDDPMKDMVAYIVAGKQRKKSRTGEPPDEQYGNPQTADSKADSGEL